MSDLSNDTLARQIKKKLPFDSPAQEAFLNLQRTASQLAAPSEQLFKQHGISSPKYNILRILRGSKTNGESGEHGLPSLEIAQRMITRVPDITRLVNGLVEDGLVARTRCSQDRRVVYVGITQRGLHLLNQLDEPLMQMHKHLMAHLTADELGELNRLLVKSRACPSPVEKLLSPGVNTLRTK